MTSFSRQQIEALRMLLSMPPAERDAALNMFLAPQSPQVLSQSHQTPQSARVRRHDSHGSASSHPSPDNDESVCSALSNSSRVHQPKDKPKILASYLVKQYLSSNALWKHLYNEDNRIDNQRLDNVLKQIVTTLTKEQQDTLAAHRRDVIKLVKKKIAAGRNYRRKLPEQKRKKLEAPMAHTIDLTVSDEDEGDVEDHGNKGDNGDQHGPVDEAADDGDEKKERRKMLAKKFAEKMSGLREKRKTATKGATKKSNKNTGRVTRAKLRKRGSTQAEKAATTPTKKKKIDAPRASPGRWKERRLEAGTLKVGCKISGQWNQDDEHKGEWYDGIVKSIDTKKRTVHVVFDDGDEDEGLQWDKVRILD